MGDGGPAMPVFALVLIAAIATSAGLIVVLRPLLARYALARPNARSSHREPTPQGGGIAVVAAALLGLWIGVALSGLAAETQLAALSAKEKDKTGISKALTERELEKFLDEVPTATDEDLKKWKSFTPQ